MIIQKFNVNSLDLGDPRLILIIFFKKNKETHFSSTKCYITHLTYVRATSHTRDAYTIPPTRGLRKSSVRATSRTSRVNAQTIIIFKIQKNVFNAYIKALNWNLFNIVHVNGMHMNHILKEKSHLVLIFFLRISNSSIFFKYVCT